ncbi:MAG: cation-efflux pump, partial [Candidatus Helarchaeota archaeon]
MQKSLDDDQKSRMMAAIISIIFHVSLLLLKLVIGIITNSLSIVALAADSGFDLIAAFATYWGIRQIAKPADEEHHYGHGKYDFLAGAIQALILFITAGIIISEAVVRLIFGADVSLNVLSFLILFVGIGSNIFLNRYLSHVSGKTRSVALEANAKNSLTDILNYVIVLVSLYFILFLRLNMIDGIVAIIISLFVIFEGYGLIRKCISGLMDKTPRAVNIEKIKVIIKSVQGVEGVKAIRMRSSGPFIFMDARIDMISLQSVEASHQITEKIEIAVKQEFPEITDVLIHVEPKNVLDEAFEEDVCRQVLDFPEVKDCHHVHLGFAEDHYILDLHAVLDKRCSLDYVHAISDKIEARLKKYLQDKLKISNLEILIHAEPYQDVREEELLHEIKRIIENISVVQD